MPTKLLSPHRRQLAGPEQVLLFPSIARLDPRYGNWQVLIRGCVLQSPPDGLTQRFILQFVQRALKLSPAEAQSPLFRERVQEFMLLARRGVRLQVQFGADVQNLRRKSRTNGHFGQALRLPAVPESIGPWVDYTARTSHAPHKDAPGRLCFIPHQGISVISDIDDTIKATEVLDRRQLILNTLLLPFRPVPGMAAAFRQWERHGAIFHYVSSSPWQLYRPLARFLQEGQFPCGSFHLRRLRLKDPSILQLVVWKKRSKSHALRTLLKWFPHRRFVLVGDAGEKDPELYASVAQRFPRQVAAIWIRDLPQRPLTRERLTRAFADVPTTRWRIYRDAEELREWDPCEVLEA